MFCCVINLRDWNHRCCYPLLYPINSQFGCTRDILLLSLFFYCLRNFFIFLIFFCCAGITRLCDSHDNWSRFCWLYILTDALALPIYELICSFVLRKRRIFWICFFMAEKIVFRSQWIQPGRLLVALYEACLYELFGAALLEFPFFIYFFQELFGSVSNFSQFLFHGSIFSSNCFDFSGKPTVPNCTSHTLKTISRFTSHTSCAVHKNVVIIKSLILHQPQFNI